MSAGDLAESPAEPVTLTTPAAEFERAGYRSAAPLELVPYYSWANRAPSTMRVWLPLELLSEQDASTDRILSN